MPNVNTKASVLLRDGFKCRFCEGLLLLSQAIKLLETRFPGLRLYDAHGKIEPLRSRWATVDHILPENLGGYDDRDNLVACCVTCNSKKGNTRLEPPTVSDVGSNWHGLAELYLTATESERHNFNKDEQLWIDALQREGVVPSSLDPSTVIGVLEHGRDEGLDNFDEGLLKAWERLLE